VRQRLERVLSGAFLAAILALIAYFLSWVAALVFAVVAALAWCALRAFGRDDLGFAPLRPRPDGLRIGERVRADWGLDEIEGEFHGLAPPLGKNAYIRLDDGQRMSVPRETLRSAEKFRLSRIWR
jgi:hypothetical protein